jgi:hypothetical protein
MNSEISRRRVLGNACGLAGGFAAGRFAQGQATRPAPNPAATPDLSGHRWLTFNSIIRVNQIEITRDKVAGNDENDRHTPANVKAFRDAFAAGWPGGRMTWAFSWRALQDERPNYREIRRMIRGYHERYGDDVTFIPGGYFANAYNTREQVSRDLHDGLQMAGDIAGGGYRPGSVVAGFLAADNLRYLAERENIHVCQGNIWSQYAIDNQDGDGSISYPYYPSREHFCKPAQSAADFIDCVQLDGWTVDFLAGRREGFKDGFCSRMGVGPIETIGHHGPEKGLRQMVGCTAAHFDTGFKLNGFAWVTNCWEISLVPEVGHLEVMTAWLREIRRRWAAARCVPQADFGQAWRRHYRNNDGLNYRFVQRGTGIGGSDANLEIRWFMNRQFRLALLRDWKANSPEQVIDFTRYDLPAREPNDMTRRWSLLGKINQKQTRPQDKPVPLAALSEEDRSIIFARCPELRAKA